MEKDLFKYELAQPVVLNDGLTVTELNLLQKIQAKHVRGIEIRETMLYDDFITIIGRLANVGPHVMNEIGYLDLQLLIAKVHSFLGPAGPTEPTTPSQS